MIIISDNMTKSTKNNLLSIPIIGGVATWVNAVIKLPIRLNSLEANTSHLTHDVINVRENYNDTVDAIRQHESKVDSLEKTVAGQQSILSDTNHKLTILERRKSTTASNQDTSGRKKTLADNHLLDKFYVEFEDRFRGTEDDIYQRLEEYLPYVSEYKKTSQKHPVLDIGCGRGEFLRLMKSNDIKAIGLDLNSTMAEKVRSKGFDVIEQDALSYLLDQPSESLSAITGFHIAEHIPFDELITLFAQAYRVLIPGGKIIFETPNPENTLVGSWKFYYDPSHLHPLPPDVLGFTAESVGFPKVTLLKLHPISDKFPAQDKLDETHTLSDIQYHFYGPQDYSVIAVK